MDMLIIPKIILSSENQFRDLDFGDSGVCDRVLVIFGSFWFMFGETLWLRAAPGASPRVDFWIDRGVSCLVQAVGYRVGTRPPRPIHIQHITDDENELRHDDATLHRIRRS